MSKGKAASAGASVPRPGPHLSQKLPSIMSYWPTSTYPHPSLPCDHRNIGSQCSEVFLYLSSHLFEPFFSLFKNLIAMYILKKMEQNFCSLDGSVFPTILLHCSPCPADSFHLTISPSSPLKACDIAVQEHPDVAMVCSWVCHVAWYYPPHLSLLLLELYLQSFL